MDNGGIVPKALGGGEWVHVYVLYYVVISLCKEYIGLLVTFILVVIATKHNYFVRSYLSRC